MKIQHTLCLLLLMSALSCVRPQERLQKEIETAAAALDSTAGTTPSQERVDALVQLCIAYADQYKDDTLAPVYLFKAGELSIASGQFDKALELFGRVQRYPNNNKVAEALFLQGFVSENHLNNKEAAKNYYTRFLQQYPQHALSDDARLLLQQLTLSPEDLMRMFEQQNMQGGVAGPL